MNKDFRLILDAAHAEEAHMPATEAACQVSSSAMRSEGDEDFSAVIRCMDIVNEKSRVAKAVLDGWGRAARDPLAIFRK